MPPRPRTACRPCWRLTPKSSSHRLSATRRLRLNDFILGNRRTALRSDEILSAVIVPHQPGSGTEVSTFAKLGSRHYLVISIAMVAVNLVHSDDGRVMAAKIAVGACSPVAQRLTALESELAGRKAAAGLGFVAEARHLAPLSPIDDVRATGAYRRDAALSLVRRAIETCVRECRAMMRHEAMGAARSELRFLLNGKTVVDHRRARRALEQGGPRQARLCAERRSAAMPAIAAPAPC